MISDHVSINMPGEICVSYLFFKQIVGLFK